MNTLRNQMISLTIFILSALCVTGYFSYQAIEKYFFYDFQVKFGKDIITQTELIINNKHSKENFLLLQSFREQLDERSRQENFSKVIQAYDEKSKYLSQKRLKFFKKSEEKYIEFADKQKPFLIQSFYFYSLFSLGLGGSLLICLGLFIYYGLLKPIKDLNKKMIDFLNEKYTYQFMVPKNNEMGNLQSTFNSLAQQVLLNIDELKELDHAKSEFLSIASHELRTPLTSIKGSLSLLQQGVAGPLPEEVKNLVNIANVESERLIRLINDILDLTKIEARKLPLKEKWHSLDKLVNTTFASLIGFSEAAHVTLEFKLDAPYLIFMDFDRIQQVFTNLLSNAIKHSPEKGIVTLSAMRSENGHIRIEIKDRGPGIDPEDQELIFQQFRQITSEENPLVKGTGLGLAIAKALVEQHKGAIGVESKPGEGSTFYFTLPNWKLDMSDSSIKVKQENAS